MTKSAFYIPSIQDSSIQIVTQQKLQDILNLSILNKFVKILLNVASAMPPSKLRILPGILQWRLD